VRITVPAFEDRAIRTLGSIASSLPKEASDMRRMTRSRGPDAKRMRILAALGAALAASLAATAVPAQAAVSSASIVGTTATLNLDGADDNVTVSVAGGLLVHGQATGGLNSGSD
jgi:hypothetical protein